MPFADPPNTTPETIADWLTAKGWYYFGDTPSATPEQIALALEDLGYHDFADPTAATAEEIADLINASQSLAGGTGPTAALRAWRA